MSNSAFTQAQIAIPVAVNNGGTGLISVPSNGQLLIGNGTNYTLGSLTSTGGTLTVTDGSGTLNVELALGNANTWTAIQTFSSSGDIYLNGAVAWEANFSNGNSGTSKALNLDNGNLQSVTITGAVAITQTTPTHPGKYTLIVTQDGTGHVYSLSGVKTAGGTGLTLSTAASKVDIISIIYDGTNFYAQAGEAFS